MIKNNRAPRSSALIAHGVQSRKILSFSILNCISLKKALPGSILFDPNQEPITCPNLSQAHAKPKALPSWKLKVALCVNYPWAPKAAWNQGSFVPPALFL